ncbi:type VII secretion-associated protein [Corynebacterium sp. ES2775-CONJ]|uniref:type VII secretion-associated protein n=1 Tax=Corynebacterium sp. ES2775-CONJ TaxID=2974029 RepID=UPI002167E3E9|nr:type VII secretion-associated protein [Corynebacterium sp. ES2775-CONJ]MCS4489586.1 type VII secretion-associated protein [Corynebacterium sp. ES2775-CONJ]
MDDDDVSGAPTPHPPDSDPTVEITVTVLDTATIFEGPDTVYRYDLTVGGVIDGTATSAIIDQLRAIAGQSWPHIAVTIDAPRRVVDMLRVALDETGVQKSSPPPTSPERSNPLNIPTEREVKRSSSQSLWRPSRRALMWSGLSILSVIALLGLGSLTAFILHNSRAQAPDLLAATPTSSAMETLSKDPMADRGAAEEVEESSRNRERIFESDLLNSALISVVLPPTFTIELRRETPDILTATGQDENLRVLIAADPLYDADPEFVRQELEQEARENPTFTLLPPSQQPRQGEVRYIEEPGDGSHAQWVVWIEGDFIYSLGCHSRFDLKLSQQAMCAKAAESLTARKKIDAPKGTVETLL